MEKFDDSFDEDNTIQIFHSAIERLRLGRGSSGDFMAVLAAYDFCLSQALKVNNEFDIDILVNIKTTIDQITARTTITHEWNSPFITLNHFERLMDLLELLELNLGE